MRGRKPKPMAIRAAEGDARKVGRRKLNAALEREPNPTAIIPECPAHLDDVARREWESITPELLDLGLMTVVDKAAIAGYCQAYSRWVDAEMNLQKFGHVIKTPKGYPVQNPYLGIANTAMDNMRRFLVEFGMTPVSRARLSIEKKESTEDLMEMLSTPRPPKDAIQ